MSLQETATEFERRALHHFHSLITIEFYEENHDELCFVINGICGVLAGLAGKKTSIKKTPADFLKLNYIARAYHLIDICEDHVSETKRATSQEIVETVESLSEECRQRLKNLSVNVFSYCSASGQTDLRCSWQGYGNSLEIIDQAEYICIDNSGLNSLRTLLEQCAKRDIQREKLSAQGLQFDLPLKAFLKDVGCTEAEVLEIAKKQGFSEEVSFCKQKREPMTLGEKSVLISFLEGKVRSEIALADTVKWSKGNVTARNIVLPKVSLQGLKGRPVTDVVEHPWLEGLIITYANCNTNKKGMSTLNIMTCEAA